MNVIFPLIISIYSSHILFSEGVGKVALAQNIVSYFVFLAALGIPSYGTKRIGAVQFDTKERNKVFNELFLINLISTLICTIIFFTMILNVAYFKGNMLYVIFSFLIVLNVINVDWLYQGLENYKYIAIRSIAVKTICLFVLPIFVREQNDYCQYAIILCIATVGNYFFNILRMHRYVHFDFSNIQIRRHLRPIFILFASACATEIYTMIDSTMVGTICSERDLGYYTNAMKSARMSYVFVTAACAVFLPRLSLYFKENKHDEFNTLVNQGMKIVLLLAIPIFIGIELLADSVIQVLFGIDFLPGVSTLRILAVLVIIFSVAYIGGHITLVSANLEKYTMYAAFVGALSNFIMNMILIRLFGFNGAAIASVIAEILVTLVLLTAAKKIVSYNIEANFFISIFVSTLVMAIVVISFKCLIVNKLISLVLCIIAGGCSYFIMQLLMKNEIVISLFFKMKKR